MNKKHEAVNFSQQKYINRFHIKIISQHFNKFSSRKYFQYSD